jgi:hypothetical protein
MTSWQFCTSGAAINRSGTHANSTIIASGSALLEYYNAAEGKIEQETSTAWSDSYSSLTTGVQNQLSNVCSSLVAMDIVQYDPSGYLTREADMLMNKNSSIIAAGMKELNDKTKHTLKTP